MSVPIFLLPLKYDSRLGFVLFDESESSPTSRAIVTSSSLFGIVG